MVFLKFYQLNASVFGQEQRDLSNDNCGRRLSEQGVRGGKRVEGWRRRSKAFKNKQVKMSEYK